ncbi:MAG: DNA methyltransferase, partial [Janthinobacterium lividum]
GDIVLDAFAGSGSTLIAAEKTGRLARLIEYDPAYCDVIVERWQRLTGKRATLSSGLSFEEVGEARRGGLDASNDQSLGPSDIVEEAGA